jgi:predicted nucleic acid-binding protein
MAGVLVDSNVLLDLFTRDPQWYEWSSNELSFAAERNRVVINAIIYAEISVRFRTIEELEAAIPQNLISREELPFQAAFLAGKVQADYKRRTGNRNRLLPDFLIGAHAAVLEYDLLTRDATFYRGYFPSVRLIAPVQ